MTQEHIPYLSPRESIDILARIYTIYYRIWIYVFGKGRLHNYAMYFFIF